MSRATPRASRGPKRCVSSAGTARVMTDTMRVVATPSPATVSRSLVAMSIGSSSVLHHAHAVADAQPLACEQAIGDTDDRGLPRRAAGLDDRRSTGGARGARPPLVSCPTRDARLGGVE